jgi:hypothetical protein
MLMEDPLEKGEFAQALRKGLGRALLHVLNQGLNDVADLVIDACLHDQSYDPQCESSRASWLFRMFANSKEYRHFRDSILDSLKTETDTWNLQQLCELAKEMAAHGDAVAREALHKAVRARASSPSDADWVGANAWIELQGVDGMLELARIYGTRLLLNPDDLVPDDLPFLGESESAFLELLSGHAQGEPALRAYRDYLDAISSSPVDPDTAKREHRERVRQTHTLASILKDAGNQIGEYPSRYVQFGQNATPSELEQVYAHLLTEKDPAVRLRLLWVFRRAPLPRLEETLFEWAKDPDDALRSAAIAALAQKADLRVHQLARSKARAGKLLSGDDEALDLFLKNYEDDDALLIDRALDGLRPDPEEAHSLGTSVIELTEQKQDPKLTNALRWVYENTPCTNCRYRTVKQLSSLGRLEDQLVDECEFDADVEIRAFAKSQRVSG